MHACSYDDILSAWRCRDLHSHSCTQLAIAIEVVYACTCTCHVHACVVHVTTCKSDGAYSGYIVRGFWQLPSILGNKFLFITCSVRAACVNNCHLATNKINVMNLKKLSVHNYPWNEDTPALIRTWFLSGIIHARDVHMPLFTALKLKKFFSLFWEHSHTERGRGREGGYKDDLNRNSGQ